MKDLNVKIIEFNSFGYWLSVGSALFEWKIDHDKLYNTENKIWFRLYN